MHVIRIIVSRILARALLLVDDLESLLGRADMRLSRWYDANDDAMAEREDAQRRAGE
jgi:hypothetical protein